MGYILGSYIAPAFWAFVGMTILTGGDLLVTVLEYLRG
tara:strand:+ start:700 stop:813 length:114 start_codon:yes stop_codon:yes gene_type:complete